MKYIRTFLTEFSKSFGRELAVGTVWIWRGAYFALGFVIVAKYFGAL